jgi:hypothetical protein
MCRILGFARLDRMLSSKQEIRGCHEDCSWKVDDFTAVGPAAA